MCNGEPDMPRIIQQDRSGCGLACIAMISGRTYREVRECAVEIWDENDFCTDAKDLRDLVRRINEKFHVNVQLAPRKRPFTTWEVIPHKSIVAINYKEKTGRWHWVVLAREDGCPYVLDPHESVLADQRTDFKRMGKNARWYLPLINA